MGKEKNNTNEDNNKYNDDDDDDDSMLPEACQRRLGMLTPSSNSVLEATTSSMIYPIREAVSVHYARFRVLRIGLDAQAQQQFNTEVIVEAAELLADANVAIICWNGTSSGWLGFEADEILCKAITQKTGIPATTSVLALNEALHVLNAKRIAFVTPYLGTSDSIE